MATEFIPASEHFFSKYPRLTTGVFVLGVVLFFIFNTCLIYVKPNQFGIKKINIGLHKGLVQKVYGTGYQFVIPFGVQEMYRLPKDLQVLELTDSDTMMASAHREFQKAAHIQTSDGFYVQVDVSIMYRITDPYKVISQVGPGRLYITNVIFPKVEPVLKEALGELTTEEFYNSQLRVKAVQKAKLLLQAELESKGLAVEHILIRYFRYSDEIQRNIEEKKLKDQLVYKNKAEAAAAKELANLRKMREEGEAALKVNLEKGRAYVVRKQAEKDLYVRSRRAEGDLLVAIAEANKTALRNEALQGKGADRRVGLQMADVLQGVDLIMLPSTGEGRFNPLDLDGMIDLFGLEHEKS